MAETFSETSTALVMDLISDRDITIRFFEALHILLDNGKIDNLYRFCVDYGIDRRNLLRIEGDPNRNIKMSWLAILAADFGVNADWLLTGRGERFVK